MSITRPIAHRATDSGEPPLPVVMVAMAARCVLMASLVLVVWAALPAVWGWVPTTVSSDSMSPGIRTGDVVVAMPVATDSLRTGQVLLVNDPVHPGGFRMHRFVATTDAGQLILRGDANASDDSDFIDLAAVQGVGVLRIPWVGLPGLWLREGDTLALGLTGAAAILLLGLSGLDRKPEQRRASPRSHPKLAASALVAIAAVSLTPLALDDSAAAFASVSGNPASQFGALSAYPCLAPTPADSPYFYFALNETAGTTATDASGNARTGTLQGGTARVTGSCATNQSPALTLNGSTGYVSTPSSMAGPNTFSTELWFITTSTSGGKLIGFGNAATGASSQYDRHLYMTNSGQIVFGVYPNVVRTIVSPASYNNGAWHHVTATLSSAGMMLYVDGTRVALNASVTTGQAFTGFWKIGYDNLNGWTTPPTSSYFSGSIDNAAVYTTALTATQVSAHYAAGH